jgi:hypothetical protein
MTDYRAIWANTYGPIPPGYEVHHINGDRANNHIDNLKCLTIYEHYEVHYKQGDYGACHAIALRMQMDDSEFRILCSKAQKKRFSDPAEREKARQRTKKQFADPVKRQRHLESLVTHSDKIWVNNGKKNKRIRPEDLLLLKGWKKGRLIPQKQIEKMIENRTVNRDPSTGKFMSV